MRYTHKNKGVCCVSVSFDLDGDKVSNVEFMGGCNGNLKAIARLVDGMTVDEIENKLKGNLCGMKGTSCADQFALGVREAYQKARTENGSDFVSVEK